MLADCIAEKIAAITALLRCGKNMLHTVQKVKNDPKNPAFRQDFLLCFTVGKYLGLVLSAAESEAKLRILQQNLKQREERPMAVLL